MIRSEIRDLARKRLGETTSSFWTDAELNSWIDEAGDDLAFQTKSIKTNGLLTTVEDTQEYAVSTAFPNLISIQKVEYYQDGTTWVKLPSTSRDELSQLHTGWKSAASGTPTKYYWDREDDVLGFYVAPDASNDGEYCRVYYARTYTPLSSDSATPSLPTFLHMAMSYYVAAIGFGTRGYGDKENDMRSKYAERIHKYLVELKREDVDADIIMVNYRNV